jgi:hypothetical protein
METTQNTPTEVTKPKQREYESIDESIAKMRLTLDNATLPGIFEILLTVGYTEERINLLKNDLAHLEDIQQIQTKEYADQFAETELFNNKRKEIDSEYTIHRGLVNILFKGNIHARTALKLDEQKPRTYANWFEQVSNFYDQLGRIADLQTKVSTVGVTEAKVTTQKQAIVVLRDIKESQRIEISEAQAATEARDLAFDALYPQYSEYIQYAKVLLGDNQLLEAIGVTVKR